MPCDRHATDNCFSRHYDIPEYSNKKNNLIKSLAVLSLIIIFFSLCGCAGPQSILDPNGPAALAISRLWWGMFLFFTLIFIAVSLLWFYAIKAKETYLLEKKVKRLSRWLIIGGGILLPSITILVILLFGIPIGHHILPHPEKNVMRIDVIGHQWFWEIQYPDTNITLINELHLPLNQPVDMYVTSDDVIHSFWVPRLNGKVDAIPGHINVLRLLATKPGYLRGQCAEFCGKRHAQMVFTVKVHKADSFKSWLQEQKNSSVRLQKINPISKLCEQAFEQNENLDIFCPESLKTKNNQPTERY